MTMQEKDIKREDLRKEGRDGIRQRGSDCQTISRTGSLVAGVIGLILLLSKPFEAAAALAACQLMDL